MKQTSRIVHLVVPHLPVQVEVRRSQLQNRFVVGGRPWDPGVVLDAAKLARQAGVEPGMPLARAALRCPEALFIPADYPAYLDAHSAIEAALRAFTERVETADLGRFYLQTAQLQRAHPQEDALARALMALARQQSGLDLQVGLASERFTAEQAAQMAELNGVLIVPPRSGRSFLAPLPLSVLPIDPEMHRRLIMVGVRTLGDLAALPRLSVIRQFGAQAGLIHDLAAGADPRPVQPNAPPLALTQHVDFEPPIVDSLQLAYAVEVLAGDLADELGDRRAQAQGVRVALADLVPVCQSASGVLEPPTAGKRRLARRALALMNTLSLPAEIQALTLVVYPLRPAHLGAGQLALFSASRDARAARLREALRRIRQRFGPDSIVSGGALRCPEAQAIEVETDRRGVPRRLGWDRGPGRQPQACAVSTIYEHWQERTGWWAHPRCRDYYRLEDRQGRVRVVYQDLVDGSWWLEGWYEG